MKPAFDIKNVTFRRLIHPSAHRRFNRIGRIPAPTGRPIPRRIRSLHFRRTRFRPSRIHRFGRHDFPVCPLRHANLRAAPHQRHMGGSGGALPLGIQTRQLPPRQPTHRQHLPPAKHRSHKTYRPPLSTIRLYWSARPCVPASRFTLKTATSSLPASSAKVRNLSPTATSIFTPPCVAERWPVPKAIPTRASLFIPCRPN